MNDELRGKTLVLAAYFSWGVLPVYWEQLAELPPEIVLFQRTLWSVAVLAAVLLRRGTLLTSLQAVRQRGTLHLLALSALLLIVNWLTYLWAIAEGKMIPASMGYFICPVLSIVLGALFLRERMSGVQQCALLLMVTGVILRTALAGETPWIALILAASFSSYALVRKIAGVEPVIGLFIEVLVMLVPACLLVLCAGDLSFSSLWSSDPRINVLIMCSGIATVLPLLWLVRGAQLVGLGFVGAAQYLAPTLMFVLAVAVSGESIKIYDLVTLPLFWIAALLFVGERSLRRVFLPAHRLH